MKASSSIGLASFLAIGVLSGCGALNSTSPISGTTTQDQTDVSTAVAAAPVEVLSDGLFDSNQELPLSAHASPRGALGNLNPRRFWRNINHVERRFDYAFSDSDSTGHPTRAIVTINRLLTGTFNVVVGDSMPAAGDSAGIHVVRKPLADYWVRRIALERTAARDSGAHRRGEWRVVGASGVRANSRDADELAATRILSVRIQSDSIDRTVDDPLQIVQLTRALRFNPGGMITITVTTRRADDVVVLMHHDRRMLFHNNADMTYSAVVTVPDEIRLAHVGVNVFSHGTLFDALAPYSSSAWVFPFVTRDVAVAAAAR